MTTSLAARRDYRVADLSLAPFGRKEIHLAEHERFERQGSNLYASLPVTFAQAALGSDVFVGTIDGEEKIKIPNGTQTGTVYRIKGKGMPVLGGRGRGDPA